MYLHRIRYLVLCVIFCLLEAAVCLAGNWQDDFERICSNTDNAYELSAEKLKMLIEESDVLLKDQAAGEPKRKVQLFRLKKCRNLFEYMLKLKEPAKIPSKGSGDY